MKKYLVYLGAFGLLALGIIVNFINMPIWLLLVLEFIFMGLVIYGTRQPH